MHPANVTIDKNGSLTIENFGCNPEIPATFIHHGKIHKGYFSETIGMGGYYWNLSVNKFFRGTMGWMPVPSASGIVDFNNKRRELRFWSHHGDLDYLEKKFIEALIGWYQ